MHRATFCESAVPAAQADTLHGEDAMNWEQKFSEGLSYEEFLAEYGDSGHGGRWQAVLDRVSLTGRQLELLSSFKREMKVLCLAGVWCGDCVNQCPVFEQIAQASENIHLRFLDRDDHPDVQEALVVNAGKRVPVLVFLSEDFHEVARYGDRTLSRYRELAVQNLGPSCPTGIVPPSQDSLAAVTQDWLNEFERVQLILRLSSRLRQKHGD